MEEAAPFLQTQQCPNYETSSKSSKLCIEVVESGIVDDRHMARIVANTPRPPLIRANMSKAVERGAGFNSFTV
jgi:hypothetical protein